MCDFSFLFLETACSRNEPLTLPPFLLRLSVFLLKLSVFDGRLVNIVLLAAVPEKLSQIARASIICLTSAQDSDIIVWRVCEIEMMKIVMKRRDNDEKTLKINDDEIREESRLDDLKATSTLYKAHPRCGTLITAQAVQQTRLTNYLSRGDATGHFPTGYAASSLREPNA